jgi:hypothetical protein
MIRYLFSPSFTRFDLLRLVVSIILLGQGMWLWWAVFAVLSSVIAATCEFDLLVRSR